MLSNANREINWLAPHPLALLLIFIQRAPSVYPVKRRRRGGGSGVGQAARSLDPFSIATAGSPGGTKSRVASSAPTKGAGSRHRSLSGDIPCPEQHPYLHCLLPPSSPPPSSSSRSQDPHPVGAGLGAGTHFSLRAHSGCLRRAVSGGGRGGGGGGTGQRRRSCLRGCGQCAGGRAVPMPGGRSPPAAQPPPGSTPTALHRSGTAGPWD